MEMPNHTVRECVPDSWKVLADKAYSALRDDNYLRVVLCQRDDDYVTWTVNLSAGGAHHGHYFDTFDKAFSDYARRTLR